MTLFTGYSDTWNRTLSGSFGTADTGQAYTLQGVAADFAVAAGTATITPSTLTTERFGYVDLKTVDFNVTTRFAFSALPASGNIGIGLGGSILDASNSYKAYLQIVPAGTVALGIGKLIGGSGSTLIGVGLTGVTLAANTYYNLRFARIGATFYAKFWSSATEPFGWTAVVTDPGTLVNGTGAGPYGSNNSAATGIVLRYQATASATHSLPYPSPGDPMKWDPNVAYPRQTAAQSLATALDSYMSGTIDPDVTRTTSPAWVRVSKSNWSSAVDGWYGGSVGTIAFDTVEYNSGTPTDLTANPTVIILGSGYWALHGEITFPGSATMFGCTLEMVGNGYYFTDMRIDSGTGTSGTPDQVLGGCGQLGGMMAVVSGTASVPLTASVQTTGGPILVSYIALTAIKISDFFS